MLVLWLPVAPGASQSHAQGLLGAIRDDVRAPRPSSSSENSDHRKQHHHHGDRDDDDDWGWGTFLGGIVSGILSSDSSSSSRTVHHHHYHYGPAYGGALPYENDATYDSVHVPLDSDGPRFSEMYFTRFPYDHVDGYMTPCEGPWSRRWAGRLRFEYADTFDGMSRVGGHLLLSTTRGWGLDSAMGYLEEKLPGNTYNSLWIGDCNIIYRLSEDEKTQMRIGAGFNWLDDPIDTNYGFNFTFGMDFFHHKPWIVSGAIDWGTLGSAELFRFRTTAGIIINRVETYIGYEYFDVDRTQTSSLIAGVRFWF